MKFINCSNALETILDDIFRGPEVLALVDRNEVNIEDLDRLVVSEDPKVTNKFAEIDKVNSIIYFNPEFVSKASDSQIREVFYHELAHYAKVVSGQEDAKREVESTPADPDEFAVIKEDVNLKRMQGYTPEEIAEYIKRRFWAFGITNEMVTKLLETDEPVAMKPDTPPHQYPNTVNDFTDLSIPFAVAFHYAHSDSPKAFAIAHENLMEFVARLVFSLEYISEEVYSPHKSIVREMIKALTETCEVIDTYKLKEEVSDCLQSLRGYILDILYSVPYIDTKLGHLSHQLTSVNSSIQNLLEISTVIQDKEHKTASLLPVVKKTIQEPKDIWVCPHCQKEIGEKELFHDGKVFHHRSCGGEISLPKTASLKVANDRDFKVGDVVVVDLEDEGATVFGVISTIEKDKSEIPTYVIDQKIRVREVDIIRKLAPREVEYLKQKFGWTDSSKKYQELSDIPVMKDSVRTDKIDSLVEKITKTTDPIEKKKLEDEIRRLRASLIFKADLPSETLTQDSKSVNEQVLTPGEMTPTTYVPTEISTTLEKRPQDLTWLNKMIESLRRRKP